jgi:alpha-tubulin suppressor-like RCC1 family protein
MGWNQYGQLGDATSNPKVSHPERLGVDHSFIVATNVTAIAAGVLHSLFLRGDGSLWAMGDNSYGELGDGTYNMTNRPELIVANGVTAIAAGSGHSLFLKSDGSLWAMGRNNYGQLGDGTYNNTNQPEQIVGSGVTAIAAGGKDWSDNGYAEGYSLFVKNDGSLWGMGYNGNRQLGDGTRNNTNRPEQILAAYNQIASQPLSGGSMQLSFEGIAGANYALDRSFSLAPPNWIPQVTNPANSFGALVFTNSPDPATNNFWRIRSVP